MNTKYFVIICPWLSTLSLKMCALKKKENKNVCSLNQVTLSRPLHYLTHHSAQCQLYIEL